MVVLQIRWQRNKFTFGNSLPCSKCHDCLKSSHINNIIYSQKNGSFTLCNMKDLPKNEYTSVY